MGEKNHKLSIRFSRLQRPTSGFGAGRHIMENFSLTLRILTVQVCCDMSTISYEGFELRRWVRNEDKLTTIR